VKNVSTVRPSLSRALPVRERSFALRTGRGTSSALIRTLSVIFFLLQIFRKKCRNSYRPLEAGGQLQVIIFIALELFTIS
jgi:hypothetical protein